MQHISWVFVCHQVYPRSKKAEIQRDFVAITKMDVSMNSLLVRAKFFSLRFKTAFMNLYHPTCLYSQHHLPNKTSFPASGAWSLPPLHPRSLGVTMVPGATKASPKEGSQRLPNQRLPLKKRGKPREGMDNEIHNDMFWGFDNVWYQRCLIWFALGIPSASEMSRWCWCHVAAHVVCTREIIRCSCWPMTKSLRVNWFLKCCTCALISWPEVMLDKQPSQKVWSAFVISTAGVHGFMNATKMVMVSSPFSVTQHSQLYDILRW